MDNELQPRKSPLLHWFEHPVDLKKWMPLSILQRLHQDLYRQHIASKPRGPARAVVYKGKSYPSLRAAAKANSATAAPEMLEALCLFDNFAWTALTADCREARDELNRRLTVARAAIAKARHISLTKG